MAQLATRTFGSSRFAVTTVGLGCNNFGRAGAATQSLDGTRAVLDRAIESGITFLDTADIYGAHPGDSELLMGEAVHGRRDEVIIATKFGHQQVDIEGTESWGMKGTASYVLNALDASLRRLQTDPVDLYQMHMPDPYVPIGETLEALDEQVKAGKVLHIGHSNFTPEQAAEAQQVAEDNGFTAFVSAQNNYSLVHREPEDGLLEECEAAGLGFLPFYPLANGLLTGKYTRSDRPSGTRLHDLKPELLDHVDWDQLEALQQICDDAGISMLQGAIGWLLSRPVVTSVIAGATKPEQVEQNAKAADVELSPEVVKAMDTLFPR